MSVPRKYRRFTREYKENAVRLTEESGKTVRQVAVELGIPEKVLYRWRSEKAHDPAEAFRGNGRRTATEAEVVRLRRENAQLKIECDILKKAAAWFAKQQL
jgi:transposase